MYRYAWTLPIWQLQLQRFTVAQFVYAVVWLAECSTRIVASCICVLYFDSICIISHIWLGGASFRAMKILGNLGELRWFEDDAWHHWTLFEFGGAYPPPPVNKTPDLWNWTELNRTVIPKKEISCHPGLNVTKQCQALHQICIWGLRPETTDTEYMDFPS